MLSLICDDIENETAVAVQRGLNSLERHITAIQLPKDTSPNINQIFLSTIKQIMPAGEVCWKYSSPTTRLKAKGRKRGVPTGIIPHVY